VTSDNETARRLEYMLENIDAALKIVGDADLKTYLESFVMQKATERCIEIVSEASKHVPDDIKAGHPEIPWQKIRGIGNVFRHQFSVVDDHVVWLTVKVALPELRPVIVRLLDRYKKS